MIANMFSRRFIATTVALLTALTAAATALGALPKEPADTIERPYDDWLIYLVTIVLLLGVATAAFKSAKRSHLD